MVDYNFVFECFRKLDTLVSIEYERSGGSRRARLSEMKSQITGLTESILMCIKSVYSESYSLTRLGDDVVIEPPKDSAMKLKERAEEFKGLLRKAISGKDDTPITDLITYKLPVKAKTKKSASKVIKNVKSKFTFHEKKPAGKTSLLERIRRKEKAGEKTIQLIRERKEQYVDSKRRAVYDILYEESPKDAGSRSITIDQLERMINDASSNPMAREDVIKVIRKLDTIISKISFVVVGSTGVVKIGKLDRGKDLALLAGK